MTVHEARYTANEQLPLHSHSCAYLCLVLDGGFRERWLHRDIDAVRGAVYFLPAGNVHSDTFSPTGAHCLRVEVQATAFGVLVEHQAELESPWYQLAGPKSWHALHLYRSFISGELDSDGIESLVAVLLDARPLPAGRRATHFAPRWLLRVLEALHDSPGRAPSLRELAGLAGVHQSHLARTFFAQYGCSVGEFVQTRRITAACRFLAQGHQSLAAIAAGLGYHDQSHFTHAFRGRMAMTPGAYRARARR